jgi:hypothetical protein
MSALSNAERQTLITRLAGLTGLQIDICASADATGPTGIPTDVSYAAQSITLTDAGDNVKLNHTAVTFPAMAVNVTVNAFYITTTSGTVRRLFGTFDSPQTITAGNTFSIAANTLNLRAAP